MARYIDADNIPYEYDNNFRVVAPKHQIDHMTTEDIQPVTHAEWELVNEDENVYMCSNCGDEFIIIDGTTTENHMLYCPFCGAKMDKE